MSPRPRKGKPTKPTKATGEKPEKARGPFVERRGAIVVALFKVFDDPKHKHTALSNLPPRPLTVSDEQAVTAILDDAKLDAGGKLDMLRMLFQHDWEIYHRANRNK